MGNKKKEEKTSRLKKLEGKFLLAEKSKKYLQKELSRIMNKEEKLREKTRKEKQAILFSNRAKKLRSQKKR